MPESRRRRMVLVFMIADAKATELVDGASGSASLRPLKVLMICPSFGRAGCGVGDNTVRLAAALERLGHSVIVARDRTERSQSAGPRVIPWFNTHSLREMWSLRRLISDTEPDLVHLQYQITLYNLSPAVLLAPLLMRLNKRIPVVVTMHDLITPRIFPKARPLREALLKACLKNSTAIVVTTGEAARRDVIAKGVTASAVHAIPAGSNIDRRPLSQEDLAAIAARYGISDDRHIFTTLGTVSPNPYWELWLDAIASMDPDQRNRCQFLIVGGGPTWKPSSNAYHGELQRMAEARGIGSEVRITGFVPQEDVAAIFALSHYFVRLVPNGTGPGSTATAAALVHGLPIIAIGDHRLQDPLMASVRVSLVQPDAAQLGAAMTAASSRPYPPKAIQDDQATFGWDAIAARHQSVYSSVARSGPKPLKEADKPR